MATLPSSLLSKFYEPDSLRNTDSGFEMAFKNRLAPSTLIGIGSLKIDGYVFQDEDLTLRIVRPAAAYGRVPEPLVRSGDQVSVEKSLSFGLNSVVWVAVVGDPLPPGQYEVAWTFTTREVGDITVQASDQVEE